MVEDGPRIALRSRWIFDGTGDTAFEGGSVLLEGSRIAAVGRLEISRDVPVVDLGEATLLPGLVDCHVHPFIQGLDYQTVHLRESSAYKALRGLKAVQDCLDAGWTTLRVAGDADVHHAVIDLRRAIDRGLFVGPRLVGAAHYLTTTGGGGDINDASPEQVLIPDGRVVDGVDAVRKAVREEIKRGSDWIKVLVTGAFMAAANDPRSVQFSQAELDALVDEATRWGVPVMAHAHAAEGIKCAVRAGVRSIEHGTFADDEALIMMKEAGVTLVPTVYIGDYYPRMASAPACSPMKGTHARRAIEKCVKVVVGSDLGGVPARANVGEIVALVEAGMSPAAALRAATRDGAELLGLAGEIGTLESGKRADVIAVTGNALADVRRLEDVTMVMRDARFVRGPGTPRSRE